MFVRFYGQHCRGSLFPLDRAPARDDLAAVLDEVLDDDLAVLARGREVGEGADELLVHAFAVGFDGDSDGLPGGTYDFWFQTRPLQRALTFNAGASSALEGRTVTVTGASAELAQMTKNAAGFTKRYFLFYFVALLMYLAMTLVSNVFIDRLERYVRRGQQKLA